MMEKPMRRYLSALRARQGEISRGRMLAVLVVSLTLLVVGYAAFSFADWDGIQEPDTAMRPASNAAGQDQN